MKGYDVCFVPELLHRGSEFDFKMPCSVCGKPNSAHGTCGICSDCPSGECRIGHWDKPPGACSNPRCSNTTRNTCGRCRECPSTEMRCVFCHPTSEHKKELDAHYENPRVSTRPLHQGRTTASGRMLLALWAEFRQRKRARCVGAGVGAGADGAGAEGAGGADGAGALLKVWTNMPRQAMALVLEQLGPLTVTEEDE